MSHKMLALILSAASLLAFAPGPALAERPADADIDRLLEVMDMETMLSGMMQQMSQSQEAMVAETFGKDLSEAERARMQALVAKSQARVRERLSWAALEPIFRKVYAQVFSKDEVDAMTAFYGSPTGASILRKSPQAMAASMQEMQPLMQQLMQDLQADLSKEFEPDKP